MPHTRFLPKILVMSITIICAGIFMPALAKAESVQAKSLKTNTAWELFDNDETPVIHTVPKDIKEANTNVANAYQSMLYAVRNLEPSVTVTSIDEKDARKIVKEIKANPEIFWVGPNTSMQLNENDTSTIYFNYVYSKEEVHNKLVDIDSAYKSIDFDNLKGQDNKTISEYICKYIIDNTEYDKTLDTENPDNSTIVGSLLNKKCLCGGYAKAYSYLMARNGIDSSYCTGDYARTYHAWNRLCSNGDSLGVDVTHADSILFGWKKFCNFEQNSTEWNERQCNSEIWFCLI